MLKRTLTGAVYVAIIAGFFILRQFADYRLFNVLIWLFCALGTFEVARAVKKDLFSGIFHYSLCFGILFVPVYCTFQYLLDFGGYSALIFSGVAIVLVLIYSIINKKASKFFVNALPFIYPCLLLLTTLLINELNKNAFIALILVFVISPICDTFAYFVGMSYNKIRKGKAKKMCPNLSPKKTWAGAIGGVLGGVVASVLVMLIFDFTADKFSTVILFVIIGMFAAIFTEIGDLFESYIKRKVGIKDMGRLMPGHGGIMDRIDGMTFASAFIFLVFVII